MKLLMEYILPEGTIVAWNKSFEMDVHKKLAARLPEYRPFLDRTITMFYDLKDVFHKQYYVHPEFRGSTSIKKVLPALVPSLQYKELGIHGGAQALDAWWTMLSAAPVEAQTRYFLDQPNSERSARSSLVRWQIKTAGLYIALAVGMFLFLVYS